LQVGNVALVLAVITMLGVIFSRQVIVPFPTAADISVGWSEAIALNRIMFPYIFFVGLAALGMGVLNCFQHFALPASTTVLLNLSIIAFSTAVVWRHFHSPAVSLAVGVLVGGALQFLILIPQMVRRGMRFDFGISFMHPGIRSVAGVMFPRFFGLGISQINFFVDTYIAVATAILPMMAHQAAANNYDGLKKTLTFAVRIVAYITVPAAMGLMILREPVIRVLFQHGQFVAASTSLTARPLLYYAIGLPALACVKLIVPAFYSARDTKTPVIVASISFVLNIVLNIIFLEFLFKR